MALQPPSSADSTQKQLSLALCGWPKSGLFLLMGNCLEEEPCTATSCHLVLDGKHGITITFLSRLYPGTAVPGPVWLAQCGWPKYGLFLLIGHSLEDEPCTATTSHLVLGGNPVISTICLCSANPGTPVSGPLSLAQILTLAHCGPLGGG